MTFEALALVLTLVVHFLGAAVLIWGLLDGEQVDWRGFLNPGDDGGGGRRRDRPRPDSPPPLPDADQSPERFREPGRLADRKARPPRRQPERAPAPAPAPAPAREGEPA